MAESAQLKIWQFGNQAAGAEPGIIIATIDHPVVLIHADPATTPDMCPLLTFITAYGCIIVTHTLATYCAGEVTDSFSSWTDYRVHTIARTSMSVCGDDEFYWKDVDVTVLKGY